MIIVIDVHLFLDWLCIKYPVSKFCFKFKIGEINYPCGYPNYPSVVS